MPAFDIFGCIASTCIAHIAAVNKCGLYTTLGHIDARIAARPVRLVQGAIAAKICAGCHKLRRMLSGDDY
jgi:hypothetical protein